MNSKDLNSIWDNDRSFKFTVLLDSPEFYGKLVDARVIRPEVKKCLDNMDPGVDHELRKKFLLMHMYDSIRDDDDKTNEVCSILNDFHNVCLGDKHIYKLLEGLVPVAPYWRNLGRALGLEPYELDHIALNSKNMETKDDLEKVLCCAVSKGILTVNKLVTALRSQIMNQGSLAIKLSEYYGLGKRALGDGSEVSPSKKQKVSHRNQVKIVASSKGSINVEEGRALLLFVEASYEGEDEITYQWSCSDKNLGDKSDDYIGVTKPILCIKRASISMDGYTYKCSLHKGDLMNKIASTSETKVSIPCILDEYRTRIENIYNYRSAEDDWPTPNSKEPFFNLAIIKSQKIKVNKHIYARETIWGDMDDVLKDKDIKYNEVFHRLESSSRVLIEGRPGCGKTTLVDKICKDWARGEIKLGSKLVLKISLRTLLSPVTDTLELEDLFCFDDFSKEDQKKLIEFVRAKSGEGLCFIFDGLDEVSLYENSKKFSIVFKIFKKSCLPLSVVILASRPSATVKLRRYASKHVEVIGFFRKEVINYIDNYNFSDATKARGLKQYLNLHPNVLHMCYLPIHTAIVSYLYDMLDDFKSITTEAEIYEHFTDQYVERNQHRLTKVNEGEMAPATVNKYLHAIYKMAFDASLAGTAVTLDQPVLHEEKDCSLGLVVEDKALSLVRWKRCHTFLHFTFQEYFSACHFSELSREHQLQIVKDYGSKIHLHQMWKFYFGMKETFPAVEQAILTDNSTDTLFLVHCLYETKSKAADWTKLNVENSTLSFKEKHINPRDFAGIAFVLSSYPYFKTLSFNSCTISREGVKAFFNEIGEFFQLSLHEIQFLNHKCHGEDDQLQGIRLFIESLPSLKHLDMTGANLRQKHTKIVFKNLVHNLEVIKLSSLSKENADILLPSLHNWKSFCAFELNEVPGKYAIEKFRTKLHLIAGSLIDTKKRSLHLEKCNLKENHLKDIFKALHGNKKWKQCSSLNVAYSDIGREGVECISASILECSEVLKELYLHHNRIKGIQIKPLANQLQKCVLLSVLDLSFNPLEYEGATALSSGLKVSKHLKVLKLSHCCLGTEGIDAVSKALKGLASLCCLHVMSNNIESSGAAQLANELSHCHKLQELNIGKNKIGNKGMIAIIGSLFQHCSEILKIILDNNNLENDEAVRLFKDPENVKRITLNLKKKNIFTEQLIQFCTSGDKLFLDRLDTSTSNDASVGHTLAPVHSDKTSDRSLDNNVIMEENNSKGINLEETTKVAVSVNTKKDNKDNLSSLQSLSASLSPSDISLEQHGSNQAFATLEQRVEVVEQHVEVVEQHVVEQRVDVVEQHVEVVEQHVEVVEQHVKVGQLMSRKSIFLSVFCIVYLFFSYIGDSGFSEASSCQLSLENTNP